MVHIVNFRVYERAEEGILHFRIFRSHRKLSHKSNGSCLRPCTIY